MAEPTIEVREGKPEASPLAESLLLALKTSVRETTKKPPEYRLMLSELQRSSDKSNILKIVGQLVEKLKPEERKIVTDNLDELEGRVQTSELEDLREEILELKVAVQNSREEEVKPPATKPEQSAAAAGLAKKDNVKDAPKDSISEKWFPESANPQEWTGKQIATLSAITLGGVGLYAFWKWMRGEKKGDPPTNGEKKSKWKWLLWVPVIGIAGYGVYKISQLSGLTRELEEWKSKLARQFSGKKSGEHVERQMSEHDADTLYRETVYRGDATKREKNVSDVAMRLRTGGWKEEDIQSFMEHAEEKYHVEVITGVRYISASVACENYTKEAEDHCKDVLEYIRQNKEVSGMVLLVAYKIGFVHAGVSVARWTVSHLKDFILALAKCTVQTVAFHPIVSLFAFGAAALTLGEVVRRNDKVRMPEHFADLLSACNNKKDIVLNISIAENIQQQIAEVRTAAEHVPSQLSVLKVHMSTLPGVLDEFLFQSIVESPEGNAINNLTECFHSLVRWLEQKREKAAQKSEDPKPIEAAQDALHTFMHNYLHDQKNPVQHKTGVDDAYANLEQCLSVAGIHLRNQNKKIQWREEGEAEAIAWHDLCIDLSVDEKDDFTTRAKTLQSLTESSVNYSLRGMGDYLQEEFLRNREKIPCGYSMIALPFGGFVWLYDLKWSEGVPFIDESSLFKVASDAWSHWEAGHVWTAAGVLFAGQTMMALSANTASTVKSLAVGGKSFFGPRWLRVILKETTKNLVPVAGLYRMGRDSVRAVADTVQSIRAPLQEAAHGRWGEVLPAFRRQHLINQVMANARSWYDITPEILRDFNHALTITNADQQLSTLQTIFKKLDHPNPGNDIGVLKRNIAEDIAKKLNTVPRRTFGAKGPLNRIEGLLGISHERAGNADEIIQHVLGEGGMHEEWRALLRGISSAESANIDAALRHAKDLKGLLFVGTIDDAFAAGRTLEEICATLPSLDEAARLGHIEALLAKEGVDDLLKAGVEMNDIGKVLPYLDEGLRAFHIELLIGSADDIAKLLTTTGIESADLAKTISNITNQTLRRECIASFVKATGSADDSAKLLSLGFAAGDVAEATGKALAEVTRLVSAPIELSEKVRSYAAVRYLLSTDNSAEYTRLIALAEKEGGPAVAIRASRYLQEIVTGENAAIRVAALSDEVIRHVGRINANPAAVGRFLSGLRIADGVTEVAPGAVIKAIDGMSTWQKTGYLGRAVYGAGVLAEAGGVVLDTVNLVSSIDEAKKHEEELKAELTKAGFATADKKIYMHPDLPELEIEISSFQNTDVADNATQLTIDTAALIGSLAYISVMMGPQGLLIGGAVLAVKSTVGRTFDAFEQRKHGDALRKLPSWLLAKLGTQTAIRQSEYETIREYAGTMNMDIFPSTWGELGSLILPNMYVHLKEMNSGGREKMKREVREKVLQTLCYRIAAQHQSDYLSELPGQGNIQEFFSTEGEFLRPGGAYERVVRPYITLRLQNMMRGEGVKFDVTRTLDITETQNGMYGWLFDDAAISPSELEQAVEEGMMLCLQNQRQLHHEDRLKQIEGILGKQTKYLEDQKVAVSVIEERSALLRAGLLQAYKDEIKENPDLHHVFNRDPFVLGERTGEETAAEHLVARGRGNALSSSDGDFSDRFTRESYVIGGVTEQPLTLHALAAEYLRPKQRTADRERLERTSPTDGSLSFADLEALWPGDASLAPYETEQRFLTAVEERLKPLQAINAAFTSNAKIADDASLHLRVEEHAQHLDAYIRFFGHKDFYQDYFRTWRRVGLALPFDASDFVGQLQTWKERGYPVLIDDSDKGEFAQVQAGARNRSKKSPGLQLFKSAGEAQRPRLSTGIAGLDNIPDATAVLTPDAFISLQNALQERPKLTLDRPKDPFAQLLGKRPSLADLIPQPQNADFRIAEYLRSLGPDKVLDGYGNTVPLPVLDRDRSVALTPAEFTKLQEMLESKNDGLGSLRRYLLRKRVLVLIDTGSGQEDAVERKRAG